jgi:hypothetical protein
LSKEEDSWLEGSIRPVEADSGTPFSKIALVGALLGALAGVSLTFAQGAQRANAKEWA